MELMLGHLEVFHFFEELIRDSILERVAGLILPY